MRKGDKQAETMHITRSHVHWSHKKLKFRNTFDMALGLTGSTITSVFVYVLIVINSGTGRSHLIIQSIDTILELYLINYELLSSRS